MSQLSGTVTLEGDAIANAQVCVIDADLSSPGNWSVVGGDVTGSDGSWSVGGLEYGAERYHALVQLDDGNFYNAESLPFLSVDAVLEPGPVPLSFSALEPTFEYAIPDSGVARWNFEDDSDTTVAVDSWYDNDGSITGATYTTDSKVDRLALLFDGTGDNVDVADSADLSISSSGAKSVSAWVNLQSSQPGENSVVWKHEEYALLIDDADTPAMASWNGRVTASTALSTNTYYHLVGIVDSSVPEALVYIDGSHEATSTLTASSSETTNPLGIGADTTNGDNYLNAIIDDPRIYDKRLSSTEVANLYNTGSIDG